MSIVSTKIEIFLFDTHIYLSPLEDTNLLKPSFRFLVDQKAYDAFYEKNSRLEVGNSSFRPFSNSEIEKNHFWYNFGKRRRPLDPWLRHLPIIYEPPNNLEFVLDEPSIITKVFPEVLIWPWGWSCCLFCSLNETLNADALCNLLRCQKSGNLEPGTFILEGERIKCNKVFQKISEKLGQHLFSDDIDYRYSLDSLGVNRHFVLSLLEIEGQALPYETPNDLRLRRLCEKDRAELHSILLGKTVTKKQLLLRERANPKKFLMTSFGGVAFGLTDFDRGTLLYLPRLIANGEEKGLEAKHCLGANIQNCSKTALSLAGFLKNSDFEDTDNPKIQQLRKSALKNLEHLAEKGVNNFHKGFMLKNTRVKKFLPSVNSFPTVSL